MKLNPGSSAYDIGIDDEKKPSPAERLKAEGAKPFVPGGRSDRFEGVKRLTGPEVKAKWGKYQEPEKKHYRRPEQISPYANEMEVTRALAAGLIKESRGLYEAARMREKAEKELRRQNSKFFPKPSGKKPERSAKWSPGFAQGPAPGSEVKYVPPKRKDFPKDEAIDARHPIGPYHDVMAYHGLRPVKTFSGQHQRSNFYQHPESGKGAVIHLNRKTGAISHTSRKATGAPIRSGTRAGQLATHLEDAAVDRKHPIAAYHDVMAAHGMKPAGSKSKGEYRINKYQNPATGKQAGIVYNRKTKQIGHSVGYHDEGQLMAGHRGSEEFHTNLSLLPHKKTNLVNNQRIWHNTARESADYHRLMAGSEQHSGRKNLHRQAFNHFQKAAYHYGIGNHSQGHDYFKKGHDIHKSLYPELEPGGEE